MKNQKDNLKGKGGIFIIPCDAWSLTGSRGDEAMLMVIQALYPNMPIHIATATSEADASALVHGWLPEHCWTSNLLFTRVFETAKKITPSACFILGADVMDGYYSPNSSIAFFALADIMAYNGIPTSLLGFSFNANPHPKVLKALQKMEHNFTYNLRDPESLKRFERSTGKKGELVADVAFLLEPDKNTSQYSDIASWKRTAGNPLLIVNLHPMLIKHAKQEQILNMIETLHFVLEQILEKTKWNILLLPHDDRRNVNDNICLTPLYEGLQKWGNRIRHLPDVLDAAKLKGIVSLADALVTSRMHLGIAGLSQAIPTMGVSYQDKFQGMIEHFGLDKDFILPLPLTENRHDIESSVKWLLDNKDGIHLKLLDALPNVIRLAKKNFVLIDNNVREVSQGN